jgi:hypothetical protein
MGCDIKENEMDKASYERRRDDEQRRYVRFTLPGGLPIYVDRYTISIFGTDLEMKPFIRIDGIVTVVQENVSEIKTALGVDCVRKA